jgi:ABC-type multidrug transport system ATPase subunit
MVALNVVCFLMLLPWSFSGKTTLLNLLANRGGVRQTCRCSGEILFNGRPADQYGRDSAVEANNNAATTSSAAATAAAGGEGAISAQVGHNPALEQRIGYVLQQEFLLPHLSVLETLRYAAQLRLSRSLISAQKDARVDEVLRELNLKAVRDSLVGDERVRGCSGGERRRLSIGVQMLTDPSILFLDEPTTGLDSFTSLSIVETLSTLAHAQGRTVVATIHQPRSTIFDQFDAMIFMVRGSVVFQGSPAESLAFFEQQGYAIPPAVNPSDFIIDLLTIDGRSDVGEKAVAAAIGASEEQAEQADGKKKKQQLQLTNGHDDHALVGAVVAATAAASAPSSASAVRRASSPSPSHAAVVPAGLTGEEIETQAQAKAQAEAQARLFAERERKSLRRVRRLKRAFEAYKAERDARGDKADGQLNSATAAVAALPAPGEGDAALSLQGASPLRQTMLLLQRTFLSLLRDRSFIVAQLLTILFVSFMVRSGRCVSLFFIGYCVRICTRVYGHCC